MSNEIESLHIQLNVTRWSATQANIRIDRVLARVGDGEVAHFEAGFRFPDAPVLDVEQLIVSRSLILYLQKKLGVQPTIYANVAP